MAESTLQKLTRMFTGAVLPPFQRESLLRLLPSDKIGDEGVKTWAKRILKKLGEAKMQEAGGDWMPGEDKFDLTSIDLVPYDVQKRVTMNRSEVKIFERNNALPAGFDEIGSVMAKKANQLLCLGKNATGDQYTKTNNQYITKDTTASTDFADPSIITAASSGKWDVAGVAQEDIAALAGNLEAKGYNVASSIILYPEVTAPIMRRAVVNAANTYAQSSIRSLFADQGFLGVAPVKDSDLYTDAGATPTVEAFDIYAIDLSQVVVGYTIEENVEVIYNNYSKNTALDAQVAFTPLFLPREFDDGYVYKGVSRITAIDANT